MEKLKLKMTKVSSSRSKDDLETKFCKEIIEQNEGLVFTTVNGKRPYTLDWPNTPLSFSDAVLEVARGNATGIGILHAHSGTL